MSDFLPVEQLSQEQIRGELATLDLEMRDRHLEGGYHQSRDKQARYRDLLNARMSDLPKTADARIERMHQLEDLMRDTTSEYWVGRKAGELQKEYRDLLESRDAPKEVQKTADEPKSYDVVRHVTEVSGDIRNGVAALRVIHEIEDELGEESFEPLKAMTADSLSSGLALLGLLRKPEEYDRMDAFVKAKYPKSHEEITRTLARNPSLRDMLIKIYTDAGGTSCQATL